MVDGTHYLKGMAMYSEDMPDGVDIIFNTNKRSGTPKLDVLKKIQNDPDNPFGAFIKAGGQSHYIAEDGTEKLSAINKLKEEGDWDKMSKNLSSQFLSKQPIKLIQTQLDLTYADAEDEFSEICSLTCEKEAADGLRRRMRFCCRSPEGRSPSPSEYPSYIAAHGDEGNRNLCPQLSGRREGCPRSVSSWRNI